MKAAHEEQQRMLDLATTDQRLRRAIALRDKPAQAVRIRELIELRNAGRRELADRVNARDDIAREVSRIESDVTLAKTRIDRDRARLDNASSVKDTQALEREIESLMARIRALEDLELEVMERLEYAEGSVRAQEITLENYTSEGQHLTSDAKAQVASAEAEVTTLTDDRQVLTTGLPDALLALYDRVTKRGVIGAGLLSRATCGACNVVLAPSELATVRAASADDVVQCPECDAILVRTEESGL